MGTSYDGIFFYGLAFTSFDDNDPDGWPQVTRQAFEAVESGADFEEWLHATLGVAHWRKAGRRDRDHDEWTADIRTHCLEMFGVPGFQSSWMGLLDYNVYVVAPEGAMWKAWRGARVPTYTTEDVARWERACTLLREKLPGAAEPGFFYGCSVS